MSESATLKPQLCRLKLTGMLDSFEDRLSQAIKEKWDHVRFLVTLLDDEIQRREHKKQTRRTSKSGLDPSKTMETFDFSFNPKIHEQTIIELTTGHFMEKAKPILIVGPSGVGKSHLAQAIGNKICQQGHEVHFDRTSSMLKWVWAGKGDGSHERRIKQMIQVPLLILDDFGLQPLTPDQQNDLYEIICERYEKKATIITSNRDFGEWISVFENPLMGSAALDRMVHRAYRLTIVGDSYRAQTAKEMPQL